MGSPYFEADKVSIDGQGYTTATNDRLPEKAKSRTHLSLGKDSPEPWPIQSVEMGRVVAVPQVGGLHHRYERRAA